MSSTVMVKGLPPGSTHVDVLALCDATGQRPVDITVSRIYRKAGVMHRTATVRFADGESAAQFISELNSLNDESVYAEWFKLSKQKFSPSSRRSSVDDEDRDAPSSAAPARTAGSGTLFAGHHPSGAPGADSLSGSAPESAPGSAVSSAVISPVIVPVITPVVTSHDQVPPRLSPSVFPPLVSPGASAPTPAADTRVREASRDPAEGTFSVPEPETRPRFNMTSARAKASWAKLVNEVIQIGTDPKSLRERGFEWCQKPQGMDKPKQAQSNLRFGTFNVEWFDMLFEASDRINPRRGTDEVPSYGQLASMIAGVIQDLQCDLIAIIEGPRSKERLRWFVGEYLEGMYHVQGPGGGGTLEGGSQKLYLLVKKQGTCIQSVDENPTAATFFKEHWKVDVDGDCILSPYRFTHPPLCVDVWTKCGGLLSVIALHLKSKFIQGGESSWFTNDIDEKMTFIKGAVRNRRRIAAEVSRVRKYVEMMMQADPNAKVIICGDFNDGPGMDFFETNYLTVNCTDALMGSTYYPSKLFCHALLSRAADPDKLWSAVHRDFIDGIERRKVLLDHILVSPGFAPHIVKSEVAHEIFDKHCKGDPEARRGNRPSDHRPVYVEFKW